MYPQEVFFETNGVPRVVEVAELKAAESAPGKKPARERGDPTRPGSVSAPMSGVRHASLQSQCLSLQKRSGHRYRLIWPCELTIDIMIKRFLSTPTTIEDGCNSLREK